MLLIKCPHCGEREQTEFSYHGEAHIARPLTPAALSDAQWADYLFFRKNPKGVHYERWMHAFGCRRFFQMARNTASGEIYGVYLFGEDKPAAAVAAESESLSARDSLSARRADSLSAPNSLTPRRADSLTPRRLRGGVEIRASEFPGGGETSPDERIQAMGDNSATPQESAGADSYPPPQAAEGENLAGGENSTADKNSAGDNSTVDKSSAAGGENLGDSRLRGNDEVGDSTAGKNLAGRKR